MSLSLTQIKTFWQKIKNIMNPEKKCYQYKDFAVSYSSGETKTYSYNYEVSRNNQPVYFLFSGHINQGAGTGVWISINLYVDNVSVQYEAIQCKASSESTNGDSNDKVFSIHYIETQSKGTHNATLYITCNNGTFDMYENSHSPCFIIREV